jgi:uncharacterized protein YndB with AHSA1/START domain
MTSSGTGKLTLPSDTQIQITRELDAPARLVWKTYTTPELIRRWWAGGRGTVTVADVDLRVGGRWRFVLVRPGGIEVAFHGEYREIIVNERLVRTEAFERLPDADAQAALLTTTFTENDGRTVLDTLIEHRNKGNRDAHLRSGMEAGVQDGMDLLEQIAVSLAD